MKKRGQITVFIIIGLIIALAIGLTVYFTAEKTKAPIKKVPAVAEEVQEIYDYVVSCIDMISKDGLTLLGQQGGYIDIPAVIQRTPDSYIAADAFGAVKTPVWYYEGEDRTPPISYMETQLAKYVKDRLPECVADFESFSDKYEITAGEIIPIVTFTNENVLIETIWPVKVKRFDKMTQIESFAAKQSNRIKQMWEMADKAMKKENKEEWFENLTIDFMAMDPNIPMDGLEMRCGIKRWQLKDVTEELQRMLAFYLPKIRIKNTVNPEPIEPQRVYDSLKKQNEKITKQLMAGKEPSWPKDVPEDVLEVNRMTWDIGLAETDLKGGFVYYPNWKMKLIGKPHDGGMLKSGQVKGAKKFLQFICVNQWHFTYDVIYPVKMIIKDEEAYDNEGYIFQMAFPVVIQNNHGNRAVFGHRQFKEPEFATEYCNKLGEQIFDIRAMGFSEYSPVAEEIKDAKVKFTCLSRECELGTTTSDATGAIRLTGYLPQGCSNPLLSVEKEGYLAGKEFYKPGAMEILMTKLQKMDYKIEVYPYQSTTKQWLTDQIYETLPKDYTASVSLSLKKQPYDQIKEYPAELKRVGEEETDTLELAYEDAVYELDVIYLKKDLIIGGYHNENLTISFDDIAGKNEIIIKVVEYAPLPITDEQQGEMLNFIYEKGMFGEEPYYTALKPEFR